MQNGTNTPRNKYSQNTPPNRRRRKRRWRIRWGNLIALISLLALVALCIWFLASTISKKFGSDKKPESITQNDSTQDEAGADDPSDASIQDAEIGTPDGEEGSSQPEEGAEPEEGQEPGASEEPEEAKQPEEAKAPFTLADLDNPEGFDTRPTENGIVLQNEQFALDGLDTTKLDWGQGGDKDEWNRPAGCLQYQEKFGKYNAYFIKDEPEKKVIYLTMDEGYEYGCSERILDTLKEKNVHAVFFVTKPYAEQNPELVKRMIAEGHEVGNHSVTHPAAGMYSQSIEEQTNEVMGNHDYIKEQFGYDMHLFRYPAGKFNEQSLALLNNLNYKTIFWSFAYLDYDVENQPDVAESLQKIMSCLHPGAIYLLHAESETNTQLLGDFIDQVRAQGYEFKVFQ